MTTYKEWPSDGGPHTSDSIGQALAGLVARDSAGNPLPGMIAPPTITAVVGAWKVQVSRFVYVRNVAGSARFSGLSADEQIDIPNASTIPAGQARIDRIVFDPASGLVRIPGVVAASPVAPADGGFARAGLVRVQAGDAQVVAARVTPDFVRTSLAGGARARGSVPMQSVPVQGTRVIPVVFPAGMFDEPPHVMVSLGGTNPDTRDTSAAWANVTKYGFDVILGSASPVGRVIGATWTAEAA